MELPEVPEASPERVMRRGVRLGVDVGTVRIGVASCDRDGLLATPVETVKAEPRRASLDRLAALAAEYEAFEVVVGLPRSLSGGEGPAAAKIRALRSRSDPPSRPGPAGPAGRRAPLHRHRDPGSAGLGGQGQEGQIGGRPSGRRGYLAERT